MTRLKLGPIEDDTPVKITVELPAALHRDLLEYGKQLAAETNSKVAEPGKLIVPMVGRFMDLIAASPAAASPARPDARILEGARGGIGAARLSSLEIGLFNARPQAEALDGLASRRIAVKLPLARRSHDALRSRYRSSSAGRQPWSASLLRRRWGRDGMHTCTFVCLA